MRKDKKLSEIRYVEQLFAYMRIFDQEPEPSIDSFNNLG